MFATGFLFALGAVAALIVVYVGFVAVTLLAAFVGKTVRDVEDYREQQAQGWRHSWQRTAPDAWRYTWLARRINLRWNAKRQARSEVVA